MKLGLLTFHSVCNFGANLQTLSTLAWLRAHGHDVKVIDWSPHRDLALYRGVPEVQQEAHQGFFRRHYDLTAPCLDDQDVARAIEDNGLESIIIGSDAVFQYVSWRTALVPNRRGCIRWFRLTPDQRWPNPFLGTFLDRLRRWIPVAYLAISAQNADYRRMSRMELNRFRRHYARFVAITVRDSWTQGLFERIFPGACPPPIVPDPVFGLNQNYMRSHPMNIRERFGLPERYILVTFPRAPGYSSDWLAAFRTECGRNGQACLSLPLPQDTHLRFPDPAANIPLPLTPEEWFQLLAGASGYVGVNMHPVVTCMHTATPFFSFDHYGLFSARRGVETPAASKVFDLLNRAGLLECYHNVWQPLQPAPADVFRRLMDFDRDRCDALARLRFREYKAGMNNLVRSLVTSGLAG